MKILIKYATRGRAELFKRMVNTIVQTIGDVEYLIFVSADTDDDSMNNQEMRNFMTSMKCQFHYDLSESKVHAINRDMSMIDFQWDMLINMSDDMEFIVRNWGPFMIQRIKERWPNDLDWFAHFNDGYIGDALPTMSIMGRKYYERFGYIYHPEYKSFSCDAEAMYVSQMLEKYGYFPFILFKHQHPTYTGMPNDATYKKNSLATEHDIATYWRRLNKYFDVELKPGMPIPFRQHIGRYS